MSSACKTALSLGVLDIKSGCKETVLDYLMGAFPVNAMEAIEDDEGNVTMRPLTVEGVPVLCQEALRLRDELITELACLPAVHGVLDALLATLGTEMVAEVTGRSRRIIHRDGRRVVERRSTTAAKTETDSFMSGKKRVLVFSDAGGTGRSYHADLNAANVQRRCHYMVEPGWRADAAIQGLGRSHRTNQACAPLFRLVTTNIHGEKRFTSTIARRLDSLGALTRGERRAAGNGLFRAEDNLESPWAHRALQAFYIALHFGEVEAMDRAKFEDKTGLNLLDHEGCLKSSEDLPPMNTFLNRLLALRIADQNALFAAFDKILSSILERAQSTGQLDRGMEDIVADDVQIAEEEVIRTDPATGAETRLLRFKIRTRRTLRSADEALEWVNPDAITYVVNTKTGNPAIAEHGLTTPDDKDRLQAAIRLHRPERHRVIPAKTFEESAWEPTSPAAWRAAWNREIAEADPWVTRELALVCGLLLPIWSSLPRQSAAVRRLKAPDGRRWLGRVIESAQIPQLKAALGLTTLAEGLSNGGATAQMVLTEGASLCLTAGLWLRRARVMDRWRLEIVGGYSHRSTLQPFGCFVEIIDYAPRVFVPTDRPDVLTAVMAKYPPQSVLPKAA